MESLRDQWRERLAAGPVYLADELEVCLELRDAIVPAGFNAEVDEDSVLFLDDGEIRGLVRARLIPPGAPLTAEPPEAGAVGLDIDGFERYVEIETLDMPADSRGRGLGRLVMAGIADLADRLAIENLILEASKTGRYAWARCGFRFLDPDDERARVFGAAAAFAERLGRERDLGAVSEPWQLAELPGTVTRAEIQAAGGPAVAAGSESEVWGLGKALLLGPSENATTWNGVLDPRSGGDDRVRLDDYARAESDA